MDAKKTSRERGFFGLEALLNLGASSPISGWKPA